MFAALLKKQLLELGHFYTVNNKTGKRRSGRSLFGFVAILLLILLSFGTLFYGVAEGLGAVFLTGEAYDPVFYFSALGVLAVFAGAFGSAFTTYSFLFRAKDNDLLLSMPIPPFLLLLSRTVPVFLTSFLYTGCAWIPSVIVWFRYAEPTFLSVFSPIFLLLLLAMFVTVIACLIGWLIALIASRIRNKTVATAAFTLIFLFGYYFIMFRVESLLESLLLHKNEIARVLRGGAFPIYAMAKAATGDGIWLLISVALISALFALLFFILSRTFLRITTESRGAKKTVYREKKSELRSVDRALLANEFRRWFGNATYLLNTGIGVAFLLAGAILLPIKGAAVREQLGAGGGLPGADALLSALGTAAAILLSGMDTSPACSVSLEGKSLWIVRSFPIETPRILRAKRLMHLTVHLPAAAVFLLCAGLALGISVLSILAAMVCAWAAILLQVQIAQIFNLRRPNYAWTSAAMVVKQGIPVAFSMLSAVAIAAVAFALPALLGAVLPAPVALLIAAALFAGGFVFFHKKIGTKGVERFESE